MPANSWFKLKLTSLQAPSDGFCLSYSNSKFLKNHSSYKIHSFKKNLCFRETSLRFTLNQKRIYFKSSLKEYLFCPHSSIEEQSFYCYWMWRWSLWCLPSEDWAIAGLIVILLGSFQNLFFTLEYSSHFKKFSILTALSFSTLGRALGFDFKYCPLKTSLEGSRSVQEL